MLQWVGGAGWTARLPSVVDDPPMSVPVTRMNLGRLVGMFVAALHGVLLLAAVAVSLYAVVDAAADLGSEGQAAALGAVLDIRRWAALLGNTGVVCGVAVMVAVGLGGVLGVLATRTDLPGRRVLWGAALFGACLPPYVILAVFFTHLPLFRLAAAPLPACGALYGLVYTPLAVLVLGIAFRSADREVEEQAMLDMSPRGVLWYVTLPMARWAVAVLAVLLVVLVATDSSISDLLMVRTFAEEVYTLYVLDQQRVLPVLTAAPLLLVVGAALAILLYRYRGLGEQSGGQFGAWPAMFSLGRWRWVAKVLAVLAIAGGLGWPLVTLVVRAAQASEPWSRAAYMLSDEIRWTLLLAAAGASLAALPTVGLAGVLLSQGWRCGVVLAGVALLLATPAPVVGISLKELLNRPGVLGAVHDSPFAVSLGYFIRFLPLGVLLLVPGVRRVPSELEQAARLDGCGWARLQWHVRRPAVAPYLALAWLVILILCFGEIGATVLLHAPGSATAAISAYYALHKGVYADLALLALLSAAVILLPWGLLVWWWRRATRAAGDSV